MSGKFKRSLLSWLGILAVFVVLQFVANRGLVQGTPPEIRGTLVNGQDFPGLAALPKPAVVYFWASWCGVCRAMRDTVLSVNQDTPLVTVALQSGNATEVGEYLKKESFNVPVVVDEDGALGKQYGLRGVPAVFVLGPDGEVRFASVGYTSLIGLRARLWLAGL